MLRRLAIVVVVVFTVFCSLPRQAGPRACRHWRRRRAHGSTRGRPNIVDQVDAELCSPTPFVLCESASGPAARALTADLLLKSLGRPPLPSPG